MKQTNDTKVHEVDESKLAPGQILATDGPRPVTAPPNESAAKEARTILSHE
jgi:hypothetical protein